MLLAIDAPSPACNNDADQMGWSWRPDMTTTQTPPAENSYVESRAYLLKRRWEPRFEFPLDVQTNRLMPGPRGEAYYADIVLQDTENRLPLVVFEVKSPGKTSAEAVGRLRQILDSRRFIKLIKGEEPQVVLVVGPHELEEGKRIREAVGSPDVEVEVA
jgi:hypothetical protein